jgi:hypothetical protein
LKNYLKIKLIKNKMFSSIVKTAFISSLSSMRQLYVIRPLCVMSYSSNTINSIKTIIRSNEHKLTKLSNKDLDIYDKAFGFNNFSKVGNHIFKTNFGLILEDIYSTSKNFNKFDKIQKKILNTSCDGFNDNTFFECKMKWNTMKSSMAFQEIKSKLINANSHNKNFSLLVLVDKPISKFSDLEDNLNGRNIPLHLSNSLSQLQYLPEYNENIHRYISSDYLYEYLWPIEWMEVKKTILDELHLISGQL